MGQSNNIHPTAIIEKSVKLGRDVKVAPYAVIEGDTEIGDGNIIGSHAHIGSAFGTVKIGARNQILSGAVVGTPPQDLSYKGEKTVLEIGDENIIREFVTINCGTLKGGGVTRIGHRNMLMAYVHVAHDCQITNNVVIANTVQLAGHVEIDDYVRIGGMSAVAQFAKLGKFAYIGGGSEVNKDVVPFSIAQGSYAVVRATNKIGMERAGFSKEEIENIHRAIRCLIKGERTIDEALKKIEEECAPSDHIKYLVDFVRTSENGVAR